MLWLNTASSWMRCLEGPSTTSLPGKCFRLDDNGQLIAKAKSTFAGRTPHLIAQTRIVYSRPNISTAGKYGGRNGVAIKTGSIGAWMLDGKDYSKRINAIVISDKI